jgi:uncharacterized membrane protein YfhO
LKYKANAQGDQLAVFSEVWYGPDKGWHAYIDGQPAELMRANYILRALNVPSGQHEIEMVFRPKKYYMWKTVATVVSLGIVFILLYFIFSSIWTAWHKSKGVTQPVPSPTSRKGMKTPEERRKKR